MISNYFYFNLLSPNHLDHLPVVKNYLSFPDAINSLLWFVNTAIIHLVCLFSFFRSEWHWPFQHPYYVRMFSNRRTQIVQIVREIPVCRSAKWGGQFIFLHSASRGGQKNGKNSSITVRARVRRENEAKKFDMLEEMMPRLYKNCKGGENKILSSGEWKFIKYIR